MAPPSSTRVVLVTGAGRGIGAATAERLAQDGWDVVVNDRHAAEGAETVATTVKAFGQRALIHKADVSRANEVDEMAATTMREWGRLDVVERPFLLLGGRSTRRGANRPHSTCAATPS